MKKRGFTLIELLAVIVVLAIIALIATPIVMNTIKSAKKGAAERSADSYIGAVETAVATAKLDGKDIPDGTYQIDGEGNLTGERLPNGKLTIDMKGNKPKSGTITIKDGQVTNDSTMTVGDYGIVYDDDKIKAVEKDDSYYGVTYETRSVYGENPATAFIYISKNYEEKYDENNMISIDYFTKVYLSEVFEYVYKKYNASNFYFYSSTHKSGDTYSHATRKTDGTWQIEPNSCYC